MALQYVVKTYLHTKTMNYIQNTKYLNESKIPKKVQAQKESPTTFLTTSTTSWGWNFSLYPISSPIGLKWKVSKTFKSPRSLIINTLSVEYFAIKSFSWSLNKGNAWWTISNLNCGIDVNIKNVCYNNFIQIAKIQPVRRLLVNITEFEFKANSFIGQSGRICDHQTPIDLIKKQGVRKLNISN